MARHGAPLALLVAILIVIVLALIGGGCGLSAKKGPTSAELALERAQFEQIADELSSAQPGVQRELASARAVWPTIAVGLSSSPAASLRGKVATASAQAEQLPQPPFLASAKGLTGPAAGLAGLYEDFFRLTERGWQLIDATIASIASGPPADARFAQGNSSLYIDAIYDGHFDLSLVGKSVRDSYKRLGAARAFGAKLPPAEIDRLAAAYSIPAVRLTPHPASSLESR